MFESSIGSIYVSFFFALLICAAYCTTYCAPFQPHIETNSNLYARKCEQDRRGFSAVQMKGIDGIKCTLQCRASVWTIAPMRRGLRSAFNERRGGAGGVLRICAGENGGGAKSRAETDAVGTMVAYSFHSPRTARRRMFRRLRRTGRRQRHGSVPLNCTARYVGRDLIQLISIMLSTLNQHIVQNKMLPENRHRIVIVGGGAGGLELATRLGDKLGEGAQSRVILVDRSATHLWKPLLHEVAAGSMDANAHHLEFIQGVLLDLDRGRYTITISSLTDEEGVEILPAREIEYDTLVLAIGSTTNFFGVPGAREHALAVDTVAQAEYFRRRLIGACMRAQNYLSDPAADADQRPQVNIVIIGGGATGVELSAELRNTAQVLGAYGLHKLDPRNDIRITIVEAGARILLPLPERIADETARLLGQLNIGIMAGEKVTQVQARAVLTASGISMPADLTVWAGGIQVPKILTEVGLPGNRLGQAIVAQTLQTIIDPDIFAFGDCASCPWPEKGKSVPPRAQAAHQQAVFLYRALTMRLQGKPLPTFTYHDHGSLVSLGHFDAVGNLMGKFIGRSLKVQGLLARLLYLSLYRQHSIALHGFFRTFLDTVSQWLRRRTTPRVKLH